jgi:sulfatase modifying factor 1
MVKKIRSLMNSISLERSLVIMVMIGIVFSNSCKSDSVATTSGAKKEEVISCSSNIPNRFAAKTIGSSLKVSSAGTTGGMVLIPSGEFIMGSSDKEGRADEFPQHKVKLKSFWIDKTEVTNLQFRQFVEATGWITTAEKKPDWEELKKQVPPGTPKPPEDLLVAASLVFTPPPYPVALNNEAQWWQWQKGADWRHPHGAGSSIDGKDYYPVVQVSWEDARAYAAWAGKRLLTEAEWEWAARGGLKDEPFSWGKEGVEQGKPKANTWQGRFPDQNSKKDGFEKAAPVRSFAPNGYGLFDMAGNVWEWCSDWYRSDYYMHANKATILNPAGPSESYDPAEPLVPKKVLRGGSFLCHASYCSSYRVSARMKTSPDSGLENTGFRCAKDDSE